MHTNTPPPPAVRRPTSASSARAMVLQSRVSHSMQVATRARYHPILICPTAATHLKRHRDPLRSHSHSLDESSTVQSPLHSTNTPGPESVNINYKPWCIEPTRIYPLARPAPSASLYRCQRITTLDQHALPIRSHYCIVSLASNIQSHVHHELESPVGVGRRKSFESVVKARAWQPFMSLKMNLRPR